MEASHADEETFLLFTVRNLVPRMGLPELVEAVPHMRQEIPHLRLLIGGNGPMKAALQAHIETLGLQVQLEVDVEDNEQDGDRPIEADNRDVASNDGQCRRG